ncbi:ABC transporter substrate-binding protein [Haloarculaceae archaeon H-GB2-1]|nr:ABC transporter substrate-binding protein [Haloarculaceae archaeon H-GB11]MEA5409164.1 ABC transporter substrate-binding protein [Haloarculaceae archaeon H-GB2-1]
MTFRVGSPWSPDSLDPAINGWLWRRINVVEPLLTVDYDASVTTGLAESYELADDDVTWRFSLKDGVTFHDGSSLTAEDAVFSLERVFDSGSLSGLPVTSVSAEDERTVVVETGQPFAPLPAHLTRGSAAIVSKGSLDSEGNVTKPVGTGPFQFESWESGTSITASAFSEYHGTTATVDELVYEGITDSQTRLLKLENDELDMARILPNSNVETLEGSDSLHSHAYEIPRARYLVFDTQSEPFADRRVRRAVMHAVDRQAVVDSVLEGLGSTAVGPFPPAVTDWANEDLEPYAHDPDRARTLLSEAGWEQGENGRQRDGSDLSVDIWTYSTRPLLPVIAEVVQTQLGEVGFDVSVRTMESGTIEERANSEDFGMVLWSNSVLWYPDPDRLTDFVHSEDATMFSGYANDEVDDLLARGRRTADEAERKQIYDEVQAKMQEDVPIGWLTYYTNVVGTRADVSGYEPHPTESCYHLESVSK